MLDHCSGPFHLGEGNSTMRPFPDSVMLVVTVLSAGCAIASPEAAERRCGWLQNPTPSNWWLEDKDGVWVLATQGGRGQGAWSRSPNSRKANSSQRIQTDRTATAAHAGSVTDDEAKRIYPEGWKSPRPYLRIVPQPGS